MKGGSQAIEWLYEGQRVIALSIMFIIKQSHQLSYGIWLDCRQHSISGDSSYGK